ncbi:MAG: hypothetical protein ACM3UU_07160 [Ignavibacteriales bacterium]
MLSEFNSSKLFVFVGHFGSGKTETAANFAIELKSHTHKVNIIDLDIVNPFFRTEDLRRKLEEKGINVISSCFAGTNVEMSAIPANIPIAIEEVDSKTILDIGGDDIGAKILSGFRDVILSNNARIYCVVNTFRPYTDTEEKIIKMVEYIEKSSRLKVSALVNNTNLCDETSAQDILESQKIIDSAGTKLNITTSFICLNERLTEEVGNTLKHNILVHKIRVDLPWE